jgi:hypothetical protein
MPQLPISRKAINPEVKLWPVLRIIHLLDQLHKTSQRRQLARQPIKKYRYSSSCDFRIALSDGFESTMRVIAAS